MPLHTHHDRHDDPHHHDLAHEWDERYGEAEQMWSGQPNGALVAEAADLPPGRALDVGCGEGADAVWLAQRGWQVTAVDPSAVALDRARTAAAERGVDVTWIQSGLVEAGLAAGGFDLVNVQYPALRRHPDLGTERALFEAVAPGGTLVVVFHADMDAEKAKAHGFDPADYVLLDDVRAALDQRSGDGSGVGSGKGSCGGWEVVVDEERERNVTGGQGADHHTDQVLRLRRSA